MSTRSTKWLVLGCMAGSAVLSGCPGKDSQELRPLSELKVEPSEATADVRQAEVRTSTRAAAAGDEEESAGWVAYSTGVPEWRKETGGRISGFDMVFGPGHSGASGRWTFNTDTTGAVGDALGIGISYGASTGTLTTVPGAPQTRADNYPEVQVAPPGKRTK